MKTITKAELRYGVFEMPPCPPEVLKTAYLAGHYYLGEELPAKLVRACRNYSSACRLANRLNAKVSNA